MEEQYTTLSAIYDSIETKEKILNSVNEAISIYDITPDVMVKPNDHMTPGSGRVIIEFRLNQRIIGDFMEYIINDCSLVLEK